MPAAPMVPLTIKVEATFPNPVELLVFMSLKKEASFAPIFFDSIVASTNTCYYSENQIFYSLE